MKTFLFGLALLPLFAFAQTSPTIKNDSLQKKQLEDTSFNRLEKAASFPGGDAAWNAYVQEAVLKKVKYLNRKRAGGRLVVQFIIQTDGSVADVSLLKATGTEFDDVVLDIIRNSPRWEPGVQNNRKVKAYRTQSLNYVPDGK